MGDYEDKDLQKIHDRVSSVKNDVYNAEDGISKALTAIYGSTSGLFVFSVGTTFQQQLNF